MAHGGGIFPLHEDVAPEPGFDTTLRGYDKRQVDRYVTQVEGEIAALTTERNEALAHAHSFSAQVTALEAELAEIRRKLGEGARVTFRHLGPRVEQILALAEDQAEAIRAEAVEEIAARRAEAERILVESRDRAAQANRDLELALAAQRSEQEQAVKRRLEQENAKLTAEHTQVRQLR
ncbi:MAG: DivIVA domain-containing protein, partial [Micromonosporaceae bacterium]|nr:DivIVA domain-containing protein [Micromonosporaceae bacterium]